MKTLSIVQRPSARNISTARSISGLLAVDVVDCVVVVDMSAATVVILVEFVVIEFVVVVVDKGVGINRVLDSFSGDGGGCNDDDDDDGFGDNCVSESMPAADILATAVGTDDNNEGRSDTSAIVLVVVVDGDDNNRLGNVAVADVSVLLVDEAISRNAALKPTYSRSQI